MMNAEWVAHHDDPPCKVRLQANGFCAACRLFPDTQSKALYLYCPHCEVKLKDMKCKKCGQAYRVPN